MVLVCPYTAVSNVFLTSTKYLPISSSLVLSISIGNFLYFLKGTFNKLLIQLEYFVISLPPNSLFENRSSILFIIIDLLYNGRFDCKTLNRNGVLILLICEIFNSNLSILVFFLSSIDS